LTNFHIVVTWLLVVVDQVVRGIIHGEGTEKKRDNKDRVNKEMRINKEQRRKIIHKGR
jgi:glucose-6-phosphate-specific signal transduction histidine kinase